MAVYSAQSNPSMSKTPKSSFDEVVKISTEYFNGDSLAASVFTKYALQDKEGNYLESSPDEMHRRLAKEVDRIDSKYPSSIGYDMWYDYFTSWKLVPQGSPMSGIGNPFQIQSIGNCFVIPSVLDSYAGIMYTDQQQVQIMKRRGGVGHDISNLRPKGLPTNNAAKTTDGIGIFMERFSSTTREVAQNGRRGALMLSISVHHPEIETFINIKKDRKKVTGANISIRVTDEFMQAVKDGGLYELRYPVDPKEPRQVSVMVEAKAIMDQIAQAAWDSAEPGILMWDHVIRESPADCYGDVGFTTTSTNPCGELPLCPEDSCRLLLLCVERFVQNEFTDKAAIDWDEFEKAAYHGQYCMDDLVDIELEQIDKILAKIHLDPEPAAVKSVELDLWQRIKEKCVLGRRTGLGITGLGDAMAMLGIKYGSEESIEFTDKVYRTLAIGSYKASIDMAEQRGAFPAWNLDKEKGHPFIERILKELPKAYQKRYKEHGRRNIANLTTAPAGSVSCLTQTTSGCEPAIFLSYKRRRKVNPGFTGKVDFIDELGDSWEEYKVYHHGHQKWMEITGETDETKSPYYGATAEEIDPLFKIRIQAAAQKWVDHAISNTTNLPESATPKQVADIYMTAWELKCKGVTVYRAGSRSGVLVKDEPKKQLDGQIVETNAPKRPEVLECDLHRSRIKGEEYLIVVGLLNGQPYEVFAGLAQNLEVGKKETKGKLVKKAKKYKLLVGDEEFDDIVAQFDNPNYGAFTRTLSTALRHGVPVKYLVEQLRKDKHSDLFSFSSIMARVFAKHYIKDGVKLGKACPECQSSNIAYVQGCPTCQDCGYSKCG